MSMLSEQVKELRTIANNLSFEKSPTMLIVSKNLNQAADTIEALSTKLAAANMERSERYYGGGWIPVSERLPTVEDVPLITAHEDGTMQVHMYREQSGFVFHWDTTRPYSPVIAWYLPEPYKPKE